MAQAAVADGIDIVAATPHVRDDYPTSASHMEVLVLEVREALATAGVPLEVRTGGEIALERLPVLDEGELRRFGLGGIPTTCCSNSRITGGRWSSGGRFSACVRAVSRPYSDTRSGTRRCRPLPSAFGGSWSRVRSCRLRLPRSTAAWDGNRVPPPST